MRDSLTRLRGSLLAIPGRRLAGCGIAFAVKDDGCSRCRSCMVCLTSLPFVSPHQGMVGKGLQACLDCLLANDLKGQFSLVDQG